jgi:hypothetical protein
MNGRHAGQVNDLRSSVGAQTPLDELDVAGRLPFVKESEAGEGLGPDRHVVG